MHRNLFIYRQTTLPPIPDDAYLDRSNCLRLFAKKIAGRQEFIGNALPGVDPIHISFDSPNRPLTPPHKLYGREKDHADYSLLSVINPPVYEQLKDNLLVTLEGDDPNQTELHALKYVVDRMELGLKVKKIINLKIASQTYPDLRELFLDSLVMFSSHKGESHKPFHVGLQASKTIQKVLGHEGREHDMKLIQDFLYRTEREDEITYIRPVSEIERDVAFLNNNRLRGERI